IETPMMRYTDAYDRKKAVRTRAVLSALAEGDVALVSEAGMPVIADPGYELLQVALAHGVPVEVVPGPTALTAALDVAGLPAVPFVFLGFPPRKSAARRDVLGAYADDPRTLVLYESPARVIDTLRDAHDVLGDRAVALACELTKMFEAVWRGALEGAIAHLEATGPRGEYAIVIGGAEECGCGTSGDA
ncbi:MAG: rRNA small subunit methyltransferase 1, partial [Anaerolineae bacterium]|nr:rRNA small subunit methyltransferase 1 [Anaerolineae bacterium]